MTFEPSETWWTQAPFNPEIYSRRVANLLIRFYDKVSRDRNPDFPNVQRLIGILRTDSYGSVALSLSSALVTFPNLSYPNLPYEAQVRPVKVLLLYNSLDPNLSLNDFGRVLPAHGLAERAIKRDNVRLLIYRGTVRLAEGLRDVDNSGNLPI